jgi:nucleoside-diphosphate-sugar epimerase
MADPQLVVVGAGYVGQRVIDKLGDASTLVLGRSTGTDLDAQDFVPMTMPAAYRVLYTVPPSPQNDDDVRLEALLKLLQPLPESFVYISTTGVYGDCGGELVDEDSPLKPTTDRAKRRVAAERLLCSWAGKHSVHYKILRTPGIYGPERLGISRIRSMQALVDEAEANPGNRIHVDDLVSCCIAALNGNSPAGVYNVGDGDHHSPTWFSKEVARQLGVATPPDGARKKASDSRRVATQRMRDQLGVTPEYASAEDGIRASLID